LTALDIQRFGYIGAPTAVVITDWLMTLLLLLYVRFVKGSECWGGFSRAALYNWSPMIKLAIPGLIMLEAEWLAFEILTLMASYWSTAHVAAQSVLSTTASLTFQLPFALSVAISTRVANLLGATLGDSAKTTAQLGLMLAAGVGMFNFVLVMATRYRVVRLFSDDPEVIALFVKTIPLGAVFQLFDSIGTCTAGLLRGQGQFLTDFFGHWLTPGRPPASRKLHQPRRLLRACPPNLRLCSIRIELGATGIVERCCGCIVLHCGRRSGDHHADRLEPGEFYQPVFAHTY
jgi:Na+-driven multidrug efflux pump